MTRVLLTILLTFLHYRIIETTSRFETSSASQSPTTQMLTPDKFPFVCVVLPEKSTLQNRVPEFGKFVQRFVDNLVNSTRTFRRNADETFVTLKFYHTCEDTYSSMIDCFKEYNDSKANLFDRLLVARPFCSTPYVGHSMKLYRKLMANSTNNVIILTASSVIKPVKRTIDAKASILMLNGKMDYDADAVWSTVTGALKWTRFVLLDLHSKGDTPNFYCRLLNDKLEERAISEENVYAERYSVKIDLGDKFAFENFWFTIEKPFRAVMICADIDRTIEFLSEVVNRKTTSNKYGLFVMALTFDAWQDRFVTKLKDERLAKALQYVKVFAPSSISNCYPTNDVTDKGSSADDHLSNRILSSRLSSFFNTYYCAILFYCIKLEEFTKKGAEFGSATFAEMYKPNGTIPMRNENKIFWLREWRLYSFDEKKDAYREVVKVAWDKRDDGTAEPSWTNVPNELITWEDSDTNLQDVPYKCSNRTSIYPCPVPAKWGPLRNFLLIAGGVVVGLLLVAFLTYVFANCLRWNSRHFLQHRWKIRQTDVQSLQMATTSLSCFPKSTPASPSAKKVTTSLVLQQHPIFVGRYKKEAVIVIKMQTKLDGDELESLPLLQEMAKIGNFTQSDDKMAKFLGYMLYSQSTVYRLVYRLGQGGPLKRVLTTLKLESDLKFSLIRDLAMAMNALHNSFLKVHGDLRTNRCIVDERFVLRVMVTRFPRMFELNRKRHGKALLYDQKPDMLWLAPELLRNTNSEPTQFSDVYSFALVVHEITFQQGLFYVKEIHGEKQIANKLTTSNFQTKFRQLAHESVAVENLYAKDDNCADRIVKRVKDGYFRPSMPGKVKGKLEVLENIIKECWSELPNKRPTLGMVLTKLKEFMDKEQIDLGANTGKRLRFASKGIVKALLAQKADHIQERDRCVKFMYHLMPEMLIYEYMRGASHDPNLYENVTIYFNDIVKFMSTLGKQELISVIEILDDLFRAYDQILKFYDCFPLHRVGSSLLLASGVPHKNPNHASEVAQPALQICQFVKTYPKAKFQTKAGIHSGPVMAGVIGKNIPQYSLFGDTVNTASRMASTGRPDEIQISESTRSFLMQKGDFLIGKPEEKDIKGKGRMKTYFLTGHSQWPRIPLNRRLDDQPAPKSVTESVMMSLGKMSKMTTTQVSKRERSAKLSQKSSDDVSSMMLRTWMAETKVPKFAESKVPKSLESKVGKFAISKACKLQSPKSSKSSTQRDTVQSPARSKQSKGAKKSTKLKRFQNRY